MRKKRYKRRNYYKKNNKLKLISKILMITNIIFLVIFIHYFINNKNFSNLAKEDNVTEEQIENSIPTTSNSENIENDDSSLTKYTTYTKKDTTINMTFTGDIMCHNTIYKDAFDNSTDSYDFSYIFENIKYHIQIADIAVGNLETTFAGASKGYSSYPLFNTPESLAYNLKKVGFDVLSTANNHCYDSGYKGIESTIEYLDDADISHTGTFKSEEEQNKILIKNVKGINIAFLSFTYGTNGIPIPSDKSYSVNLISEENILNQLSNAKAENPDLICVSMHWGTEYQTVPNDEQKKWADLLFDNGVDIIIGNHPHVLQTMEKREITLADGTTKDGFVVYSLGNLLADQNKNYTMNSVLLNLNITQTVNGKITINSATYIPICTYKNKSVKSKKFKIIDLKNTISSIEAGYSPDIDKTTYNTFKTAMQNIKKIIGDEIE